MLQTLRSPRITRGVVVGGLEDLPLPLVEHLLEAGGRERWDVGGREWSHGLSAVARWPVPRPRARTLTAREGPGVRVSP